MADNEYCLVPLYGGRYWAKVDAADYDAVTQHRWCLARSGNRRTLYAHRGVSGTTQMMHTFLTGLATVDHVNHDGLDNRRSNLRDGSVGNAWNARKACTPKTSTYKGVSWRRSGKKHRAGWEANIRLGGRQRYLGKFETEMEAAQAYDAAASVHFGEFAVLNFAVAVAA